MPVLTIKKLTMRFGGITAVSGLDLVVEEGQIFSVIGPNGAGKTTVFNAVTGIYEPTEGEVLFEGRPLARPLTWKVWTGAAAVGLLAGFLVALFAINVNALWKRSIRGTEEVRQERIMKQVLDKGEPDESLTFEEAEAVREQWRAAAAAETRYEWALTRAAAADYLRGLPAIVEAPTNLQKQRWVVKSNNGKDTFGTFPDEESARAFRDRLLADPVPLDDLSPDRHDQVRTAAARAKADRRSRVLYGAVGFPLGFVMGAAGALVMWRRSRRAPDVITQGGVARTFQNIRLFQSMT